MKSLWSTHVRVQWPIRLTGAVMDNRDSSNIGANETADSRPVAVNWKQLSIIVSVHVVAEVLLLLVRHTIHRLRFDFCPGKRWQQEPRENCNDSDDDEQLDQSERSAIHGSPESKPMKCAGQIASSFYEERTKARRQTPRRLGGEP